MRVIERRKATSTAIAAYERTVVPHARAFMQAYDEAALADLGPAIEAAAREWSEAEAADKRYQDLLQTVRTTGAAFDADLKALRRTLCAVASRNDKDFQKLRAARASTADEEDDPAAPPAGTVKPAEPGAPSPA